ncbi:Cytochrome P450 4V2, partial [Stegodyphus mimosarum]
MFESFFLFALVIIASCYLYKRFKNLFYFPKELKNIPTQNISLLSYLKHIKQFDSARTHPLSGVLCFFYSALAQKEGIKCIWFGFKPMIFVFKAEYVKDMLNNPDDNVPPWEKYFLLKPQVGDGLLLSKGKSWRKKRSLLSPAFHTKMLQKNYMDKFNKGADLLVSKIKECVNKPWVDLEPLFGQYSLYVICDAAFGIQENEEEAEELMKCCQEIMKIRTHCILRPWTYNNTVFSLFPMGRKLKTATDSFQSFTNKVLHEKLESMLAEKRNNSKLEEANEDSLPIRKGNIFVENVLECYLKEPTFTLQDAKDEINTFIVAGHATTTVTLNWATYLLGLYPEVQEKVFQELNDVFGDDMHRDVTCDDLKKMKYLDKVLKEAMRLYPAAPLIAINYKENKKIGNYVVPKDTLCILCIYKLHRDENYFPNPEEFDPERFSPENCRARHPHSYIPFSVGQRTCIGYQFALMEIKIILSKLLREFKFTSLDPRNRSQEMFAVVLMNSTPLRIRVEQRTVT